MTKFQQIIQGILVPCVFTLAPTAFRPELLYRVEPWICYMIGVTLILTQPSISFNLTSKDYKTPDDRHSALFIHLSIFLISLTSVLYFLLQSSPLNSSFQKISLFVGVSVGLLGLFIRIWSIRTLGKWFTTTVHIFNNHELIQNGPYRYIRHPSYTGAMLSVLAPVIIYGAWVLLLPLSLALYLTYCYRVKIEEKSLIEKFGEKYVAFQNTTGAFFPKI